MEDTRKNSLYTNQSNNSQFTQRQKSFSLFIPCPFQNRKSTTENSLLSSFRSSATIPFDVASNPFSKSRLYLLFQFSITVEYKERRLQEDEPCPQGCNLAQISFICILRKIDLLFMHLPLNLMSILTKFVQVLVILTPVKLIALVPWPPTKTNN